MKRKMTVLTLCALLLALCVSAKAQQPGRIPRIGFLPSIGDANNPGIKSGHSSKGLRDLGYIEGKTS